MILTRVSRNDLGWRAFGRAIEIGCDGAPVDFDAFDGIGGVVGSALLRNRRRELHFEEGCEVDAEKGRVCDVEVERFVLLDTMVSGF